MISAHVEGNLADTGLPEFPCLARARTTSTNIFDRMVILFTADKVGTVVHADPAACWPLGHHSVSWVSFKANNWDILPDGARIVLTQKYP